MQDGWVPGKTLFEIEEAVQRGTIIQYLLSDAAQKICWPQVKTQPEAGRRALFLATASRSSTKTRPRSSRRETST